MNRRWLSEYGRCMFAQKALRLERTDLYVGWWAVITVATHVVGKK